MYSKYISAAHETSLNTADIGDILKTPRILSCIMQIQTDEPAASVSILQNIVNLQKYLVNL